MTVAKNPPPDLTEANLPEPTSSFWTFSGIKPPKPQPLTGIKNP